MAIHKIQESAHLKVLTGDMMMLEKEQNFPFSIEDPWLLLLCVPPFFYVM